MDRSAVLDRELQPEFLLRAYGSGIFPMSDDSGEIHWYSPDPRAIFDLEHFRIPRSLRQRLNKGDHEIRINTSFEQVIHNCADREEGTWISDKIIAAYGRLHRLGHAHSVETFYGDELVGGLYGVSLGGAFFGESMFTHRTDGSKLALVALVRRMKQRGMSLLDTQFMTPHLERFGAVEIPRSTYMKRLQRALQSEATFL